MEVLSRRGFDVGILAEQVGFMGCGGEGKPDTPVAVSGLAKDQHPRQEAAVPFSQQAEILITMDNPLSIFRVKF